MAIKDVETDVGQALATALALAYGTDIKNGPKRSESEPGNEAPSIWVCTTGGRAPEPFLNVTVGGGMRHASVQVLALGNSDDREGARELAQSCFEALHTKAPAAAAGVPYLSCYALNSEPLLLGADESGRWMYAVNFELNWIDTN